MKMYLAVLTALTRLLPGPLASADDHVADLFVPYTYLDSRGSDDPAHTMLPIGSSDDYMIQSRLSLPVNPVLDLSVGGDVFRGPGGTAEQWGGDATFNVSKRFTLGYEVMLGEDAEAMTCTMQTPIGGDWGDPVQNAGGDRIRRGDGGCFEVEMTRMTFLTRRGILRREPSRRRAAAPATPKQGDPARLRGACRRRLDASHAPTFGMWVPVGTGQPDDLHPPRAPRVHLLPALKPQPPDWRKRQGES